MSHVATIDLEVKDLDALEAAAGKLGMKLMRGQQTYNWYGKHVGDYAVPAGFTVEDLGKCDHAISPCIDGERKSGKFAPYEIGVVKRRDGRPGYTLLWDFWARGNGLMEKVGKDCCHLKREYATVVARKQAMAAGFTVHEQKQSDGSIVLRCVR